MKKIVCEMCEGTNLVKEEGLFICQDCGCKYSVEEAKKLMRDFDSDNDQPKYQDMQFESDMPQNIIPPHTADSPNKLLARVLKVGHTTYTAASMVTLSTLVGAEPAPVFVDGPDQVGHIGTQICLENVAGKTIKYITVYITPFNAVGDPVACTVQGHSEYGIEVTGPMAVGDKWEGYCDGMWYNNSIVRAQITHIHVIYIDGTEEMYDYTTNTDTSGSSKTRKITVTRKWRYTGCAGKVVVYKDGNEIFRIKAGESTSFISDDQPFELRVGYNGTHKGEIGIMAEAGETDLNFEIDIAMTGKLRLQEI